jgi:glucokinase-like ROK family protein
MNELRENAPISRAYLAQRTGLNKTTVSSLVNELINQQIIREVGLEIPGNGRLAGRLGTMLTMNPLAGFIVSCEIGVDFLLVICTNFTPEIIWKHKEPIGHGLSQEAILGKALSLINQAINFAKVNCCDNLIGIAIGVPGLVEDRTGKLLFAPNLKWFNVQIRDIFCESLHANMSVGNEANLAALGEHYFGAAQGFDEVLYISAGVGLGGGIIHGGKVFSGATGVGNEFGHMTMDPNGLPCSCGNKGCWETQVSQSALFRYVSEDPFFFDSAIYKEIDGNTNRLSVPLITKAAKECDPVALRAFTKVGHYLGVGIASLVNALNPQLVVFGGILSLAGDYLLPVIEEEMQQRALLWNREANKVVIAQNGIDACVMGGVASVYQAILARPDSIVNIY